MFKRQASVIDAQQATSPTYFVKYANILIVSSLYQHEPCHHMKSMLAYFNNLKLINRLV